jgi:3-hydroxyacyl-CoA dehydrogenase
MPVLGASGRAALEYTSENMRRGGFISEYDAHIASKLAFILTGGNAPGGTLVPEEHILQLEKEVFLTLLSQEKTQQRIEHMLKTGKRLNN